jgi:HPt (histidine-containing phosphotransfer) domain-containing protein
MEIKRSSKLSELFIDRVPGTLQDLKQAIQSDPKSIRDHAHKLKGSCLAVGAELMAKEAESLQFECEKQQVERAPERLVRLEQQFSRVRALLQRELDSNSGVAASQPASAGRSLRTSVYP